MGIGEKGAPASKLGFAFLHFVVSPKVFHCMDLHCGGEPARVLLSGCPTVKGSTVEEKRRLELIESWVNLLDRYFMENLDEVRLVLLQEAEVSE